MLNVIAIICSIYCFVEADSLYAVSPLIAAFSLSLVGGICIIVAFILLRRSVKLQNGGNNIEEMEAQVNGENRTESSSILA